ncbi:hypothetical protein MCOR27_001929 [Pyricularia oryzae]|uniref:SMP domain-containing protein n=3 Tax=Pyricularia TaxID=48558 RepID=A0ABQ8NQK0_PYRGI|nr:hypothetical protein MCOR01_004031 [Pyricularia oryzae]KAI6300670.1 hypothetical protein MCOR33_003699 [Pyricularia grisea]KAH9430670.1 hypothetical protein MCOR02_008006 [Pyricularia oryzae]KAI6263658.1 hypothetical protein MCOR19_000292 [Pyricularia oryzae]KAI6264778.1 hypothetical protein MCOR26_011132 [Pyricularia oryzae]
MSLSTTKMSNPSKNELNKMAQQAEADLNTYEAKVGHDFRTGAGFDAGVDTKAENKFPSAEVRYGEDLTTEAARGRQGDPDAADKEAQKARSKGKLGADHAAEAREGDNDPLKQGLEASRNNVGPNPPGPGGSQFSGTSPNDPRDVPGRLDAEGLAPPSSVTEVSGEAAKSRR